MAPHHAFLKRLPLDKTFNEIAVLPVGEEIDKVGREIDITQPLQNLPFTAKAAYCIYSVGIQAGKGSGLFEHNAFAGARIVGQINPAAIREVKRRLDSIREVRSVVPFKPVADWFGEKRRKL